MVARIDLSKGNNLGFEEKWGDLIGRRWGYDIHCERSAREITVNLYDRKKFKTKKFKTVADKIEHRLVAYLGLSKRNGAWHIDLVEVDSRYKGKKLANKLYRFVLKTLDITLMAGHCQSAGGRYIWNTLAKDRSVVVYARKGVYSKVFDFPKAGKRELMGDNFDLYDTNAAIFAVAA
jgi:hypothetical protein